MENEILNKEIQFLKITYNIHIVVYILIGLIYIIVYENIYWIIDTLMLLFEINFYIFLCFYLLLIATYILFPCLKLTTKTLNFFIKVSFVLFFIVSINSLLCSIICCYNSTLFDTFYTDCPFNFNKDNISSLINDSLLSNKKRENMCKSRKCFNINNISNIYICNFYEKNIYYKSFSEIDYNSIYPEINNFTTYCSNYTRFYTNIKYKYQKYDIDYTFVCPSKTTIVYFYVLTYLFIISNLFCSSILWLFEYCSYKTILSLLLDFRNINASLKETNNTSKIEQTNNSPDNNQDQLSLNNRTEIIIIENSNKNQSIENEINENNINNNKTNDMSKSGNILMNDMNNNIFKIINRNEILKDDKK